MCMRIYACTYVYTPCDAWYPRRPEEVIRVPGTGVTKDFELSCGCWELNPGPFARAVGTLNFCFIFLVLNNVV